MTQQFLENNLRIQLRKSIGTFLSNSFFSGFNKWKCIELLFIQFRILWCSVQNVLWSLTCPQVQFLLIGFSDYTIKPGTLGKRISKGLLGRILTGSNFNSQFFTIHIHCRMILYFTPYNVNWEFGEQYFTIWPLHPWQKPMS